MTRYEEMLLTDEGKLTPYILQYFGIKELTDFPRGPKRVAVAMVRQAISDTLLGAAAVAWVNEKAKRRKSGKGMRFDECCTLAGLESNFVKRRLQKLVNYVTLEV